MNSAQFPVGMANLRGSFAVNTITETNNSGCAFNKVTAEQSTSCETETAADINEMETTNAQSVVEDEPFVSSDAFLSGNIEVSTTSQANSVGGVIEW